MKTKQIQTVGRPKAKLVYPNGPFTVDELYALNSRTVKCKLSIRQHIARAQADRFVSVRVGSVQTGKVGKPAHIYSLTKWGQSKLSLVNETPIPLDAPVVEVPAAVEAPAAIEIPGVEAASGSVS